MVFRAGWVLVILGLLTGLGYGQQRPLLTGYFGQWGLYGEPQYVAKSLAPRAEMLDRINYAQGFVTGGRCSVADPHADTDYAYSAAQSVDGVADAPEQALKGGFKQMLKLKRRYPGLKVVISLEGRAADFAADAQPEARVAFVASCVNLWVKGSVAAGVSVGTLFDGIDIDWEFPHAEDAANYVALLAEFRRQMDAARKGMLLEVAVGPSPRMMGGADMGAVAGLVDQMGLMTYDFTGPWVQRTGFVSALSGDVGSGTVSHTVEAYLAAGVPAGKLLVGVPFYGYGWRLVPEENNGLFQEGEPIRGDRSYRQIVGMMAESKVHRDAGSQAPWLFDGDAFWTYEDAVSVEAKARFAVEKGLGGLMIWELGEDDEAGTLLTAAYGGLRDGGKSQRTGAASLPNTVEDKSRFPAGMTTR